MLNKLVIFISGYLVMKKIITLFLFIPLFGLTQDCELRDEKDQFNQDPRLTTGFKEFSGGTEEFLFTVTADKRDVDLFFSLTTPNGICLDDYSRAVIVFEGGKQRATIKNGGTTNCKGNFHFIFKNQEALHTQLTNLSIKKIQSITITGNNEKKSVLTPTKDEAEKIMKMISCMLKELEFLRTDSWKPKPKQH